MMAVLISSSGASWSFYATEDDKVFLVENTPPPEDKRTEAMSHLLRECRWLFGDKRVVVMNEDDRWVLVAPNDEGSFGGFAPYLAPIPVDDGHNDEDDSGEAA